MAAFITIAILATFPPLAAAAVEISFPLKGYYRPGKYFPVRIATRGEPAGMLRMGAIGAVGTEVPVGGQDQTVIVPMLAISSSLAELHPFPPSGHSPASIPNLIALTDDDRLVAMVGVDDFVAHMLFPDNFILTVHPDTSGPLFAPLSAWQSLDGVVLDPTTASHMTQRQLAGLLAGGTVVAIEGGPKPQWPWHWAKLGNVWVASRPEAGPDDVMQPDAYSPSWGWQTRFDSSTRWRVFVAAVIFGALLFGLLLLHPRFMTPIALAIAAAAAGGAILWHSRQVTAQSLHASVYIRGGLEVLHDHWSYISVLRPETVVEPFAPLLRPVFGYDRQPAQTQIHLQCDARGNPVRFIYRQQPHTTLAFVSRTIQPGFGAWSPTLPIHSALLPMAEELYVGPSDRLAGMIPAPPGDDWPAVVITAPSQSFDSE
ncbi:MAG TPA: hypothetical protein VHY37_05540 [Tepidisphaeraceae bacterium]|nr:hypothetical protein [Tepidisphaeraceae bacterium]